jgi:DNA-binding CsgD family transcriptional regulator
MEARIAAAKVLSLSEAQRTYLRLVSEGLTSKQIANALGGSHHTINAEIGIAMRVLGAKSRQEAAALVQRSEESGSYERSYEPPAVAAPPPAEPNRGRDEDGGSGTGLPWPTAGRPDNTLSAWQRIGWILLLAAVVALLLGGLAGGVAALLVSLDQWL